MFLFTRVYNYPISDEFEIHCTITNERPIIFWKNSRSGTGINDRIPLPLPNCTPLFEINDEQPIEKFQILNYTHTKCVIYGCCHF